MQFRLRRLGESPPGVFHKCTNALFALKAVLNFMICACEAATSYNDPCYPILAIRIYVFRWILSSHS